MRACVHVWLELELAKAIPICFNSPKTNQNSRAMTGSTLLGNFCKFLLMPEFFMRFEWISFLDPNDNINYQELLNVHEWQLFSFRMYVDVSCGSLESMCLRCAHDYPSL